MAEQKAPPERTWRVSLSTTAMLTVTVEGEIDEEQADFANEVLAIVIKSMKRVCVKQASEAGR